MRNYDCESRNGPRIKRLERSFIAQLDLVPFLFTLEFSFFGRTYPPFKDRSAIAAPHIRPLLIQLLRILLSVK